MDSLVDPIINSDDSWSPIMDIDLLENLKFFSPVNDQIYSDCSSPFEGETDVFNYSDASLEFTELETYHYSDIRLESDLTDFFDNGLCFESNPAKFHENETYEKDQFEGTWFSVDKNDAGSYQLPGIDSFTHPINSEKPMIPVTVTDFQECEEIESEPDYLKTCRCGHSNGLCSHSDFDNDWEMNSVDAKMKQQHHQQQQLQQQAQLNTVSRRNPKHSLPSLNGIKPQQGRVVGRPVGRPPGRPVGRPKKIPSVSQGSSGSSDDERSLDSPSPKKRRKDEPWKGHHLWEFIRDMLENTEEYEHLVKWENKESGIFRIVNSKQVAALWGKRKRNLTMNYEKLSRSLRWCRTAGFLSDVPKDRTYPKKLVFRFGHRAL